MDSQYFPDSKVHGANMGPNWGRQDPGGPHVGPMNFAIWVGLHRTKQTHWYFHECHILCYIVDVVGHSLNIPSCVSILHSYITGHDHGPNITDIPLLITLLICLNNNCVAPKCIAISIMTLPWVCRLEMREIWHQHTLFDLIIIL